MASIQVVQQGATAYITLQRPAVRNALDDTMVAQLSDAFARLGDGVRCVILAGAGKDFCAGADLAQMQRSVADTPATNVARAQTLAALFAQIDEAPQVVVAQVHGAALGGGAGLLACCDVVVAQHTARIGFTEARLGLAPAVIAPYVLRRIGPAAARRLFVTAEVLDANAAYAVQLVDQVVTDAAPSALAAATAEVQARVMANGPEAIGTIKTLLRRLPGLDAAAARQLGVDTLSQMRLGPEAQEGLQAFLQRRPPAWRPQ